MVSRRALATGLSRRAGLAPLSYIQWQPGDVL